jgi:hypothetical protein
MALHLLTHHPYQRLRPSYIISKNNNTSIIIN